MQDTFQFTLDFESIVSESKGGSFAYLIHKPELGFGEVLEEVLSFKSSGLVIRINNSDSNIRYLNTLPSSLYQKEKNPHEMEIALKAMELKLTHAFDKLSSLSNSRTRLLPHQIESTYIIARSLKPRFLLADEVGLGKTIEAGLVMKELIFRKGYKRILVVAPSPLLIQWQQELKNKFNEDFSIVKRKNFTRTDELNWIHYNKIITSIDFIKNPKYAEEMLKRKWDMVIFDEAHRLRRDYSKITRAYLFAEKIAPITDCLLLLSATPFRGKLEELYYLLHILDPNILGSYQSFVNDYIIGNKSDLKEKISKVLIRRRKVEVGGFTRRFARTIKIELSELERQFYDETTEYVKREYNLAMKSENRAIGFVMVVFQKLLDSSVTALLSALTKRKFLLESKLHRFSTMGFKVEDWDSDDTEGVEDFLDKLDDSLHQDLQSIKRELFTLNRLILMGKSIKEDRKSQKLRETILRLKKEGRKKFIIFTQFRTTQDYLQSILSDFKVSVFHGSQSSEAKERAIQEFKDSSEIFICTEAGGEGRNLQFSNVLFNYDLPWSPLKIEQRIGRIHRFGQKDDVFIFNFASKDTVAERILEVLTQKIKLFEESIGASDALLGSIEDELDFQSNFMKFITGLKSEDELENDINSRVKLAEEGFNKLNSLVTPRLLDFNLQDYYNHTLSTRKFENVHLEDWMIFASEKFGKQIGLSLRKNEDLYGKNKYEIWKDNSWKPCTFDSEEALTNDSLEFLAFGHPSVEKSVEYFLSGKLGYGIRNFLSKELSNNYFFVFLVEFQFSLKRTEIFYMRYDELEGKCERCFSLPEEVFTGEKAWMDESLDETRILESAFIRVHEFLIQEVEKRKSELEKENYSAFKTEEYKLELSRTKHIRLLEEKLDRQEAKAKWEPTPEKRSAINRTKNEILKAREEFERELRKIRNSSSIRHKIDLFQVYAGRW